MSSFKFRNEDVSSNNRKTILFISVLLFVLNFILKIIYLDSRDIANDEPFTIYWAQAGLNEIIKMLPSENNPPFHFFLMHFWIKLFGISPFSVRFLSLCFSSFTAVVIFLIGNRFYNWLTGLTAGLIYTFSTMHVYFSHEARVYSLFALLAAISLYLFLLIIEKPDKKRFYISLFIVNLILIYSHYFGFFIIFMELISTLITKQRRKIIKPIIIMIIGLALFYLPIVYILFERFSLSTNNGTWVKSPESGQFYGFLNLFINDRINMLLLIGLFIIGGVFLLVKKQIKTTLNYLFSEKTIIVFLWLFIPYTIMFLASFKIPMFIDRYILYTSIPFYLLIAIIINTLFKNSFYKISVTCIFIISLLFTLNLNPDNFRRMKELISLVKDLKKDKSVILLAPDYADLGFTYYYNINYFEDYKNYKQHLSSDNIYTVNSLDQTKNILNKSLGTCVYIQAGSEFQDSQNSIYNYILSKYKSVKQYKVYQIYLINKFESRIN